METNIQQTKIWPILLAIFVGSFVSTLATSTINIAIYDLQLHFKADLGVVQWTLTGFMLAMGTFAPITGYFGERFSYKRVFLFAMVGFTVASVMCALAVNEYMLIAFRIVQGAFSGLIVPATMAIVYQVIPREKQAVAIGMWAGATMLAPALGPTFAGWLLEHLSWHWLFWVNVPLGLLALLMIYSFIPYYRLSVPKSFDGVGFITVIVSSASILVGLSQGHDWGWSSPKTWGAFVVGFVFLGLFVWREMTVSEPLLNLRVFANKRYSVALLMSCIITVSLYSGTMFTPLFLQNIQQVSAFDTGLILLPASLAMAIVTPVVGKVYGRLGPRILMILGIALMAAGTLPLSYLKIDISHSYIIIFMMLRNVGISFATMPASNAGMETISAELSGHASAINNWLRNVFGSFAIAVFTTMLTARATTHGHNLAKEGITDTGYMKAQAFTMGVNDVYLVATIIVVAALPFALWFRKVKLEKAENREDRENAGKAARTEKAAHA